MPIELDHTDRRILECLQKDGRLQNVDLARKVGLSPSPCLRRVRQLEESGVIERYIALVNPVSAGIWLTLYVRVWLTGQDTGTVDHFISEINALPQVVKCYLMAGDCDFLLRIVTSGLDEYRNFQIRHLTRIRGVQSIKTEISLQQIKRTMELPLR